MMVNYSKRDPLPVRLSCGHEVTLYVHRRSAVAKGLTSAVTCPECQTPTTIRERL